MQARLNGLYAITPDEPDTGRLVGLVEAALQGGASVLQYRNKRASTALLLEQAGALQNLCRKYGVPFIINDHLDLTSKLGADGVHLGGDDYEITAARALLGSDKIIGASCYNRLDLAVAAKAASADYVAFGSCFGSSTKPAAVRAPLALFAQARLEVGLPMVGIGGITPENMHEVLAAGADSVAMISAIFGEHPDPAARIAEIVASIGSVDR
jgi:thiamine-phosphate pyrophosphorylase